MTTVREFNDPHALDALRPIWDELLARTPEASYPQSLDWLQVYWNSYGANKRLRVLVVEDGSQVTGILPLAVWAAHRFEPFKALTYPLDNWGEYYGPVGPDPAATLAAGLNHIRRTPRDWHFIELGWVDGLLDEGRTKASLDLAGFHAVCDRVDRCATIDLTAFNSWDAYFASRSKSHRRHLRRNERKLAKRGKISYVRYRPAATNGAKVELPWDLYQACETIAEASWQGNARAGTMLNKDGDRAFFRECFERTTGRGGVELNLLFVDDRPAAFAYNYYYRGRINALKAAYDPDFANEGVGTVLDAHSIAESFARGDRIIELGSEFLQYKRPWMTETRPVYRYTHFPQRSIAAQLVRGKRALQRRVKSTLRRRREAYPT